MLLTVHDEIVFDMHKTSRTTVHAGDREVHENGPADDRCRSKSKWESAKTGWRPTRPDFFQAHAVEYFVGIVGERRQASPPRRITLKEAPGVYDGRWSRKIAATIRKFEFALPRPGWPSVPNLPTANQLKAVGLSAVHWVGDTAVNHTNVTGVNFMLWVVMTALAYAARFGTESENTVWFFRHYLGDDGTPYDLDPVPDNWQVLIVNHYGQRKDGSYRDVSPYNWGNFDMRNSLGHFKLDITTLSPGVRQYEISDHYHFPYKITQGPKRGQVPEHGFGVPASLKSWLNPLLPPTIFPHPNIPSGQKFEVRQIAGNDFFILPTKWLDDNGVPFDVSGKFVRT